MGERIQGGGGGENPAVQGEEGAKAQFGDSSLISRTLPDSRIQAQSDSRIPDADVLAESHTASTTEPANNPPGNSSVLGRFKTFVKWMATRTLDKLNPLSGLSLSTAFVELEYAHQMQILKSGIRKAFGGTTNGIKSWYRPLREARGIWQTIANEVATDCFGEDGNVDVEKLRRWMELLGSAEIFQEEPFCLIPHAELMRSQMHRVCECLLTNQNGAMNELNAANGIPVGEHGQSILATMSNGREPPLKPGEAALASLFAPHRQSYLPTCTIHSTINAEIRNHPERLIKMYTQMLSSDQFTFPSGYAVQQQPIKDGFITVDLINGGIGKDRVFEGITGGIAKWLQIARWLQITIWQQEGIKYAESTDGAEKYKFEMPIHNMTDILFVHFFQASNFGNRKIDSNGTYGTMLVYAGYKNTQPLDDIPIDGSSSNFLAGMAVLEVHARVQYSGYLHQAPYGHDYMRISTGSHAENIYIPALLALDLDNMEPGKAYPIGDRNWYGCSASSDIPRLAVRKVDGTPPTYEFGTLWNGSYFQRDGISKIEVYTPDVEVRNAQYWAPFRP
ncbi:MAG: hypothetical protein LBS22_04230 [Puniceicoccales bacterium]|jgi:hypothetical protein|nr:hypothetical protein [Puniceicoccales bacterium]